MRTQIYLGFHKTHLQIGNLYGATKSQCPKHTWIFNCDCTSQLGLRGTPDVISLRCTVSQIYSICTNVFIKKITEVLLSHSPLEITGIPTLFMYINSRDKLSSLVNNTTISISCDTANTAKCRDCR